MRVRGCDDPDSACRVAADGERAAFSLPLVALTGLLGTAIAVLLSLHWEPGLRHQPRSLLLLIARWGLFMFALQWAARSDRTRGLRLALARWTAAVLANLAFLWLLHGLFGPLP